ncbi:CBS domain-containing protein [Acidiphilium sp. AL]|uniref:CBS domain-containing protein n=1 Tax=Acidiphilium iwatense TaxID=768198 RepID=A0ABS9DWP0_9PROT|nr:MULTISPECIES: CBS domain-containing protein [Acidiphilium]MCF3947153.1 CBS domain-containing protein [Acidiphilium iwatense]MCU4160636.1 CBS domain-containing protein [Acidiphilium sp. AL]
METRVSAILKRKGSNIVTAVPDQSVAAFACQLHAHRIGATPVVDAENHVIGMISERDVIRGIVEHGAKVLTMPVRSLMTTLVSTCAMEDRIGDVLDMITRNRTRHIPVVTDGKLEGIVTIGDVVAQLLEEARFEVDSLRTYITSP